jgi:hydrogenase-4 component B
MQSTIMLLFILIFPMISSFIGYFIGTKNEKHRDIFNICMTGINFAVVTLLYKYVSYEPVDISINYIMGTGLHLRLDLFRYVLVWITSLIWFLITIYSPQHLVNYRNRNRYYMFFMITLSSTIGVFVSENFINLFTFFEIMSFTSYILVIHEEDEYSHRAGNIYITMAVAGGLSLLMGLLLLFNYTQTLDISKLYLAVDGIGNIKYVISALIIIGFGVKAGLFPLHIWLPNTYTAAPAPATAVLSAILSKTGIFGMILTIDIMLKKDFYISVIILAIGFINMFLGGFLAMFQRNIKKILAYSSMSQIGYIFVGIGLVGILKDHDAIAIYGTMLHIVNHALQKALLFMGIGVIYTVLRELSINKIGGAFAKKRTLMIIFIVGVLATIGMPGFNGYISKTLLHEALAEAHVLYHTELFLAAEVIFALSSSFTVAYLLKLFVVIFIEKDNGNFKDVDSKIGRATIVPMVILGGLITYIGLRPNSILYILEGTLKTFGEIHYIETHFLSFHAMKSSMITILIGCSIYLLFVRKVLRKFSQGSWYYINPTSKWLDLYKHLYKPVGRLMFKLFFIVFKIIDESLVGTAEFIGKAVESLGKIEIVYRKNIINSAINRINFGAKFENDNRNIISVMNTINNEVKAINESVDTMVVQKVKCTLKEKISALSQKMNSITSSIFIFACILVICLITLIYYNYRTQAVNILN